MALSGGWRLRRRPDGVAFLTSLYLGVDEVLNHSRFAFNFWKESIMLLLTRDGGVVYSV